jgi:TRAP-type C4-dicarboxylate transport system permease small subunit
MKRLFKLMLSLAFLGAILVRCTTDLAEPIVNNNLKSEMEFTEIIVGLLLLVNFGAIVYAIWDVIKRNYHSARKVNTGWIWIIILLQGIGALLYFTIQKK